MPETRTAKSVTGGDAPSAALLTLIAVATGALVANLYYAQPIVAEIAPEIGVRPDLAGTVVSVAQVGYGLGLFLLVSLADLVENKTLVLVLLGLTTAGLVGLAISTSAITFFAASFVVGLCATGTHVLIPFVARLVPDEQRGRAVGTIMAGVLTGIMLARPVSLFVAASFGWRAIFWGSALLIFVIGLLLNRMMPRYRPSAGLHYGQILFSMLMLVRDVPVVAWRAVFQSLLFGAFNVFWTAAPLMLADRFGMSGHGIAFFALAAAGGALAAPVVGHLADRNWGTVLTAGAMATLGFSFFATTWAAAAMSLLWLVVLTVILDAAVQTNQVVSQRVIFAVPRDLRGRVNALYMTINFIGGAVGSTLGTLTYHAGGWEQTARVGGAIGALALLLFAISQWPKRRPGSGEHTLTPDAPPAPER